MTLIHKITNEIYTQKSRLFLWVPIFVAMGICAYFSLPVEPPVTPVIVLLLGLWGLLAFIPRSPFKISIGFLLLLVLGFGSAQLRTHIIHTPIVQKDIGPVTIQGTIVAVEDQGEGASRLVLSDVMVEDLPRAHIPRKIRLRIRNDAGLIVGQRIETLARMHKPSAPVIPGGFDFQRYLYFQGIGAIGFIYKEAHILNESKVSALSNRVELIRQTVGRVVEKNLDYPQAGIAMALSIGRKTAMSSEDKDIMRAAGLAHILAISGLHVGLFSGVIFFFTRLFLVCIPGLALHYPVKKYAALCAIIAAAGYMLLAGSTIPTQRALFMTGTVFLAIILDRSPISLRLVAFAALVILLLFPESLLSASFHMSFSAVTGLIVFYNWLRPRWSGWHRQAGVFKRTALYLAGISFTTVIATLATAPFALFHFNQLALYSLITNLICIPILAFIIMPSVVLALFLIPFGLEFPAFWVMGHGITAIIETATWVAHLPHAVLLAPSWPLPALVLLVCSALWMILWTGRLKILGIGGLAACVIVMANHKLPDILIAPNIALTAIKSEDGPLYVSTRRTERFAHENWAQSYGLDPEHSVRWKKEGQSGPVRCDELACRIAHKGYIISYIKRPDAIDRACHEADIVISTVPLRRCNALIDIDLFDTKRRGAHALWLKPKTAPGLTSVKPVILKASETLRGTRPWSALNTDFKKRRGSNGP